MSEAEEDFEAEEDLYVELVEKLVAEIRTDLRVLLESAERLLAEAVRLQTSDLVANVDVPDEAETYQTSVYQETIELFLRVRALESKVFRKEAKDS